MSESDVPQERAYIHDACQVATTVNGQSFECLSDPLSDMQRTWCTACNGFFPLTDFKWEDTGETITDYYARHGAKATKLERFLCSRLFFLITAIVGVVAGLVLAIVLFRKNDWAVLIFMCFTAPIICVIILGSLKEFLLGKQILKRVCGVSDARLLK